MNRKSNVSNGLLLEKGRRTANTETSQFLDIYDDLRVTETW